MHYGSSTQPQDKWLHLFNGEHSFIEQWFHLLQPTVGVELSNDERRSKVSSAAARPTGGLRAVPLRMPTPPPALFNGESPGTDSGPQGSFHAAFAAEPQAALAWHLHDHGRALGSCLSRFSISPYLDRQTHLICFQHWMPDVMRSNECMNINMRDLLELEYSGPPYGH